MMKYGLPQGFVGLIALYTFHLVKGGNLSCVISVWEKKKKRLAFGHWCNNVFKLHIIMDMSELYSFIPFLMTITFIEGHSCRGK